MKYSIPLLCLFIICFPGKILGAEPVTVPEPVDDVISKSYTSDCNIEPFPTEINANLAYSLKIARRINAELAGNQTKQYEVLTPMCRRDVQLISSVESLIKTVCNEKAPQSEIVTKVIDKTCNNLIPKVVDGWRKGITVKVNFIIIYPYLQKLTDVKMKKKEN